MTLVELILEGHEPRFKSTNQTIGVRRRIGSTEIALAVPVMDVPIGEFVLGVSERIPKTLQEIDALLMNPNPRKGSARYQQARANLFDPSGRTQLSQWMIEGAVKDHFKCEKLEEKLKGHIDFSLPEYDLMATSYVTALEIFGMVGRFGKKPKEDPISAAHKYVLAHLRGEHKAPALAFWEVLNAYALLNAKISDAYESKELFDEHGKPGFYLALRVFNGLREVLRYKAVHPQIAQKSSGKKKSMVKRGLTFDRELADYIDQLAKEITTESNFYQLIGKREVHSGEKEPTAYRPAHVQLKSDAYAMPEDTTEISVAGIAVKRPGVMIIDYLILEWSANNFITAYAERTYPALVNEIESVSAEAHSILSESPLAFIHKRKHADAVRGKKSQMTKYAQVVADDVQSGKVDREFNLPQYSILKMLMAAKDIRSILPRDAIELPVKLMSRSLNGDLAKSYTEINRVQMKYGISTGLFMPAIGAAFNSYIDKEYNLSINENATVEARRTASAVIEYLRFIINQKEQPLAHDVDGRIVGRFSSATKDADTLRTYGIILPADYDIPHTGRGLKTFYFLDRSKMAKDSARIPV